MTERLRDCAPVAQAAVHVDQAPKVETHAVRGARVDVAAARLLEIRAHVAAVRDREVTERLRDCEPVPHDSVHVDQAIPHTRHTRRDHTTGDRNRPS